MFHKIFIVSLLSTVLLPCFTGCSKTESIEEQIAEQIEPAQQSISEQTEPAQQRPTATKPDSAKAVTRSPKPDTSSLRPSKALAGHWKVVADNPEQHLRYKGWEFWIAPNPSGFVLYQLDNDGNLSDPRTYVIDKENIKTREVKVHWDYPGQKHDSRFGDFWTVTEEGTFIWDKMQYEKLVFNDLDIATTPVIRRNIHTLEYVDGRTEP